MRFVSSLSLAVRAVAAVVFWIACAAPAAAQITYAVTFEPGHTFTATEQADMTAAIQATGADWGRYLQTPGAVTLTVRVTENNSFPRATGRSGITDFVGNFSGTNVFEQSAARKVRTGTSPSNPAFDIELTMNTDYLRNNLYFETTPASRSTAIPSNRTDAYSVFVHELGHAFAFNGWLNNDGTPSIADRSTWDRYVTGTGANITFNGTNAVAVYGAAVPVTNGNANHYGNASPGAGSNLVPGANPSALVDGLMNGVVFHFQNRYAISALDLAIAKDAGLTLAPFTWTGGSDNWTTAARWNFSSAAGANIVVPNGTPFDVTIADANANTPYTVTLNQSTSLNSLTLANANAMLDHTAGTLTVGTGTFTSGVYRLNGGTLGSGTVALNGGTIAIEGNRNVTLGSSVTISTSGTGSVGRYSGTTGVGNLTNQGTLEATAANAVLTINPTGTFTNAGTVRTTNPTASVSIQPGGTFTNTGSVNARGTVTGNAVNDTNGTFYLTGNISGNLDVKAGSTFGSASAATVDGPSTLTVGSATFRDGGRYRWQIKDWSAGATPGVGYDQLLSLGNLDLTNLSGPNTFTIWIFGINASNLIGSVSGFDSSVARSWVIADFANDLSGTPSDRFVLDTEWFAGQNNLNGGTFSLAANSSGQLVLAFAPAPVPEPIYALPFAVAALGGGVWLRRKVLAA